MIEFTAVDRPADPPPDVVVVLPEALVPMRWWRGVAMWRAEPATMTPLERFALEMALETGRAEPHEFFEITGLPGEVLLPVAARRLAASGLLAPDGDGFLPQPAARDAARTQTVYERRHTSLDIVLLPHTGDLLALDPASSGLRAVEQLRLRPAAQRSVPAELADATLADYLRERLRAGTLAGVGDDIVDVARLATEPLFAPAGMCPAYRCQGELRRDAGRYLPAVTLPGGLNRAPVALELPGADGLARHWLAAVDAFDDADVQVGAWDALARWDEHMAPHAERVGPARWTCRIPWSVSKRLADLGRNLALPIGVEARDEDTVVELTVDLKGVDRAAEKMLELDRALTAAAQPGADATTVSPNHRDLKRAWQLGFPHLVYAWREDEDFEYE